MKADGQTKICSRCKQSKSLDQFYKNRPQADGLEYRCKKCKADYMVDYRDRLLKKNNKGNGRKKSEKRQFVTRAGHPLPMPIPPAAIQGIYLDPAIIKAIQKSAAKQIMKDFSEFIEERYS